MSDYLNTETAFAFGQFGSAFADATANTITPPEKLAIVAITFLADTSLDVLTAANANVFPTIGAAAHDNGHYTRTVNGATSSSTRVVFDQENAGTNFGVDNIEVGDELYTTTTGVAISTVTALNPDDDDTKEISIADSSSISDGITVSFLKPNRTSAQGVGGMAIDSSQVFPKGLTIYGRWDSVSISADASSGGIICYFGS
tara:strand:+ start:3238 stop:3840 length:603 start_codon:yes stop_codon:yes gene_type:complete